MSLLRRIFPRQESAHAGAQEQPWLSPWDVGFRDSVLSGWFSPGGALFKGFPIGAGDIVLDAGCGDGGYANYCVRHGARVIAADIDPAMARAAAARFAGGATAIVADCARLPLEGGRVTRVIATEMLEHVDDAVGTMDELVRVGAPGALYLLSVPDPTSEYFQKRLFSPRFAAETGHQRTFERDAFEKLIVDAGLIVERRDYIGFYWSIWFTLYWNSGVDIADPRHPTLDNWVQTWEALLDTDEGLTVKNALDALMPKSQIIVARKR